MNSELDHFATPPRPVSADIVLTTFNAKYIHASFGLRYLLANLGSLRPRAALIEFDINQRAHDIVEALLQRRPRIIGIGVYIWNAVLACEVVLLLKRVAPEVVLILGGPEVSYEIESQPIAGAADFVIAGEADLKFAELCSQILQGAPPAERIVTAELPDLARVNLPYDCYNEQDVAGRIIYVEASRGCPFTCEFCLSSLDIPVRQFPLPQLLGEMDKLLARGVRHFKFVDRTFNLNLATSRRILEFFLEREQPGLFLHFEMIPDRLPEGLREAIKRFPPGMLQFEVGIQTFNPEVAERIKRRQNYERLADNLKFLREQTGVHVHADLIMGLPGETLESFAHGFDQLVAMRPQEIQAGILKRLRGTPIVRHDQEWRMVYSPQPPYELLCNSTVTFVEMQRMRRFARFWDLTVNSGNFRDTAPLLWQGESSPFQRFMDWSDWLHERLGRTHGIALLRLAGLLFEYLCKHTGLPAGQLAQTLWSDYQRGGRSDKPDFLRPHLGSAETREGAKTKPPGTLKRQSRHIVV